MNPISRTLSRVRLASVVWSSLIAAAFAVVLILALEAPAADEADKPAAEKGAPADAKEGKSEDPAAEWKELMAREQEFEKEVVALQKDFQTADDAGKQKLQAKYFDLVREFQTTVQSRKMEIAADVFTQDPKNVEAGEFVMQMERFKNHFSEAIEVGEKLLSAGHKTPSVVNTLGISQFSLHNFDKARGILEQAKKDRMLTRDGAQFVDASAEYGDFWKKEQEIRAAEEQAEKDKQLAQVELKLERGKIVVELFEDQAPNTVANFVSLVETGKYDGTAFHRVVPNFVIQGGDPNTLDDDPTNDGGGGPGYTIDCECYRDDARKHFRGSLSMAHAGPDTGGSQFFITHVPTPWLNAHTEPEKGGHTVFGRVISGMEIVDDTQVGDKIVSAKVLRKRDHEYKPETHAEKEKPLDLENGLLKQLKKKN